MKRHAGFTLVELMVVIAILGALSATAVPCYHRIQRRAIGAEAACMVKEILEAEIMHFLEYDNFFPEPSQTIIVFHTDPPSKPEIAQIEQALNVAIPVGHYLDFTITAMPGQTCLVTISSSGNSFALFRNGASSLTGIVDSAGKIDIL